MIAAAIGAFAAIAIGTALARKHRRKSEAELLRLEREAEELRREWAELLTKAFVHFSEGRDLK